MSKSRGRRSVERDVVKHALRQETRRRDVLRQVKSRPRKIETKAPPPPWDIGPVPTSRATLACTRARTVFGDRDGEIDAVLGWLFTRFPAFGAIGDEMAAHYTCLSSDGYYERWVEFCRVLVLFPRDER